MAILRDHSDQVWEQWQLAETLRRTIHLVNVVNTLACYTAKATAQFYEPLDDELILDIAIPAPGRKSASRAGRD